MGKAHQTLIWSLCILLTACRSTDPTVPADLQAQMAIGQERPPFVVVTADDTVYGIAYRFGISTRALIAANNLTPPYALTPGQVLNLPQPDQHIVVAGETLHSIAQDYGIGVEVLAHENQLSEPYYVKSGDKLTIPPKDTATFTEAFKPAEAAITTSSLEPLALPSPKKETHQQKREITGALPEDVAAELARERGKKPHTSEPHEKGTASHKLPTVGNLAKSKPNAVHMRHMREPVQTEEDALNPMPAPSSSNHIRKPLDKKPAKPKGTKQTDKTSQGKTPPAFSWPVSSKNIISQFGPSAQGSNNGISIAVPEGTPVTTAAPGEVIYAGSELKGLGNLVLIKHKNGWVSAYAHNKNLLVKKGDKVLQGQEIAKSGKTGDVKEPQLYFELREGKQPVDPISKLGS